MSGCAVVDGLAIGGRGGVLIAVGLSLSLVACGVGCVQLR